MNLPSFASSYLTKLSGLCLVLVMSSQNAYAFNLDIDNLNSQPIKSKLSYDSLITKIPTLFVFEEKNVLSTFKTIKNKYLTFYSYKNEILKASYSGGAYYLKYSNNW